jgi:hypothetical protein
MIENKYLPPCKQSPQILFHPILQQWTALYCFCSKIKDYSSLKSRRLKGQSGAIFVQVWLWECPRDAEKKFCKTLEGLGHLMARAAAVVMEY